MANQDATTTNEEPKTNKNGLIHKSLNGDLYPIERSPESVDKMAEHFKGILTQLGEDPSREGLRDTPRRAAKALSFFTKGYEDSVSKAVASGIFSENTDEMVVVKDIEMFSLCEHHLVPFMGKVN